MVWIYFFILGKCDNIPNQPDRYFMHIHVYCYILTLPSGTRRKKVTNPAHFLCSMRYGVNSWEQFCELHDDVIKWKHFPRYWSNLRTRSKISIIMMTSSNGNIFRVTGHLCGEFTGPRWIPQSFDVFFDLRPNKSLSKQWWGWWFETQSCP